MTKVFKIINFYNIWMVELQCVRWEFYFEVITLHPQYFSLFYFFYSFMVLLLSLTISKALWRARELVDIDSVSAILFF